MTRTKLADRILPTYTKGEEIFNMVSHIVGGALGIAVLALCVIFSALHHNVYGIVSTSIYGVSLILFQIISFSSCSVALGYLDLVTVSLYTTSTETLTSLLS